MGPHGVVIRSSSAYMAFGEKYDTGASIPRAVWAMQQLHYDLSYLDLRLICMPLENIFRYSVLQNSVPRPNVVATGEGCVRARVPHISHTTTIEPSNEHFSFLCLRPGEKDLVYTWNPAVLPAYLPVVLQLQVPVRLDLFHALISITWSQYLKVSTSVCCRQFGSFGALLLEVYLCLSTPAS